jgi:hypothetical protein
VTGCGGQHGLHRDQWNLPLRALRLSRPQGGTCHAIINTSERLYRAGDETINSMPPLSPIFGGGLYHTAHLGYWAVGRVTVLPQSASIDRSFRGHTRRAATNAG